MCRAAGDLATFTGIIIEQGVVRDPPPDLVLQAPLIAADSQIGDSVAVNGCCLTVTAIHGALLRFHAVPETLRRTALADLRSGSHVNLEPALRAGDRMGGHWVQGHVDGVGRLLSAGAEQSALNLRFSAPAAVLRYTVAQGSICVNGVSLTVVSADDQSFAVSVIPHTAQVTNLAGLTPGDAVNLEADLLARYVERMAAKQASGTIDPVTE